MRHHLILTAAFVMTSCLPAVAEQSQAYFTQGLQICVDFGTDGFFVKDRLEEQGWHAVEDKDYETTVLYTPAGTVWVIPPEEGASMPATCTVVSETVTIMQAEGSVRHVIEKSGAKYQLLSYQGCSEYDFFGSSRIRIWSNGQDDFCNNPDNARVEVIALEDPVVGM